MRNIFYIKKSWGVYMDKKKELINGGYYVEVSGSNGKKSFWEVVDDHVVEEGKEHAHYC